MQCIMPKVLFVRNTAFLVKCLGLFDFVVLLATISRILITSSLLERFWIINDLVEEGVGIEMEDSGVIIHNRKALGTSIGMVLSCVDVVH